MSVPDVKELLWKEEWKKPLTDLLLTNNLECLEHKTELCPAVISRFMTGLKDGIACRNGSPVPNNKLTPQRAIGYAAAGLRLYVVRAGYRMDFFACLRQAHLLVTAAGWSFNKTDFMPVDATIIPELEGLMKLIYPAIEPFIVKKATTPSADGEVAKDPAALTLTL